MKLLRKKETDDEIAGRILKLTDEKDYGIFPPPMNAQVAINELCRYFLGENWYGPGSGSIEQSNTNIVYFIESRLKKYKAK